MLTYGDGVADIDIERLLAFHRVPRQARDGDRRPPAGALRRLWPSTATAWLDFTEKPQTGEGWINGGFFVLEPQVLDYIAGDETPLGARAAGAPGRRRAAHGVPARGLLAAHGHAAREAASCEELWATGEAPWKVLGR